MCEATTIIATMGVISALGATASYIGQSQQVSANNSAMQDYATRQSQAVLDNTIRSYTQSGAQTQRVDASASQKLEQEQLATRAAQATALTSAGEAGISGTSVEALAHEYEQRQAEYNTDVEMNRKAQDEEIRNQVAEIRAQGNSQLNQVKAIRFQQAPSPLGLVGQYASIGAQTYGNLARIPTTPKTASA